ncbi:lymphocyte function-associated antigen 3-like isoform X1 [Arapaima gigas]
MLCLCRYHATVKFIRGGLVTRAPRGLQGETAETVYGLIGKDVQLDPKVIGTLSSITWMKGNNKLAEWIRGCTVEYFGRCRTAGRCDLSETTGVLIMKELKPGDTGKYSVDVNDLSPAEEFLLTVLGKLV